MRPLFLAMAMVPFAWPVLAPAQHFTRAKISIRLEGADSLSVEVEAEGDDMMNAVATFPFQDDDPEVYLLYQRRIEAYLQSGISVRADGKRLLLNVVRWKPGGKGREDGFDTGSILRPLHTITLAGKLPKAAKNLELSSSLWMERTETQDMPPMMEYSLYRNDVLLRRRWRLAEKILRFSLSPDSLEAMRAEWKPRDVPPASRGHRDD
jgi:hypothetical protein